MSHGWTAVRPNGSKTFTDPDAEDQYLRVQDAKGTELTFAKHKTFATFPAHGERFTVDAEPGDPKVWVLK